MDYNLLAYLGRFQPFHVGHLRVVKHALTLAERVAIGIGSHDRPPDTRNPWNSSQRIEMISACFTADELDRLVFVPIVDHTYNLHRWLGAVESAVYSAAYRKWQGGPYKIGIIGFDKDETSFYLSHFPQWARVYYDPGDLINATDIRKMYWDVVPRDFDWMMRVIPLPVAAWMNEYADTEASARIHDEFHFLKEYREQYGVGPFQTADMCVVQAGHVLLIERGGDYGAGLMALPGGFVGLKETVAQAAVRELFEETGLAVDGNLVRKLVERQNPHLFDDPLRSQRGRIYTHCFRIDLDFPELPQIKGADDAAHARWVPPAQIVRANMFEDHFDIIEAMGVL